MTPEEKALAKDIYTIYRYNNNAAVIDRVSNRNEIVEDSFLLKQRILMDLKEICLVSYLHVKNMKNAKINLYVSEFPYKDY